MPPSFAAALRHTHYFVLLVLLLTACAVRPPYREAYPPLPPVAGPNEPALSAAETALAAGDVARAEQTLAQLAPNSLNAAELTRYQILRASLALAQNKPLEALQGLPQPGLAADPTQAPLIEKVRARAYFGVGDAVGAVYTLVERERLLTDAGQIAENHDLIWNGLRDSPLEGMTDARLTQADPITRGWIELALISRKVWFDARAFQASLDKWRVRNPNHPGTEHLASITLPAPGQREVLQNVALLLPQSGGYAATAEAIRDGFMAAYYKTPGSRPTVRIYDIGNSRDTLLAAYNQALNDRAGFIVGPLRKEDVAQLAAMGEPPVPVLALNYLDASQPAPALFYQWGLAPEDEARQVAERAVAEGQLRAVALVPQGEWGERVLNAYSQRLQELGGAVIAARTYDTEVRDHSTEIRALLNLEDSNERHRALTGILGAQTEFEPRRREDVDMIFVVAKPDQARLISPQFRFYRASGLPIYATALIYDGTPPAADLDGMRFCDMPWMLSPNGPWAALRNQMSILFPGRSRDYARLIALGHDTYTLVTLIQAGQLQPGSYYPAASGTLTLKANGQISRGLSCAQIDNGKLRPLDVGLPTAKR